MVEAGPGLPAIAYKKGLDFPAGKCILIFVREGKRKLRRRGHCSLTRWVTGKRRETILVREGTHGGSGPRGKELSRSSY